MLFLGTKRVVSHRIQFLFDKGKVIDDLRFLGVPSVTIGQGYTVNLGSSVTIQCTVFATPSASSITWKKISQNGAESFINVANSAKYNGGTIGTPSLTVQNAGEGDEAYYVCSATNAAGTGTSSQSYLDVLGSKLTLLMLDCKGATI